MSTNNTSDSPQFKTCGNPNCLCENPQPIVRFAKNRSTGDGFQSYCRTCTSERNRQWREKYPDYSRDNTQKWRQENLEYARARDRQRYKLDPDRSKASIKRWRTLNPERNRELQKNWKKSNPARVRAHHISRAASRRGLPDDFTVEDWQRAFNYFNGCCAICGRPKGLWHTIAADHWIPLVSPDCPGTIPSNIVPLCHGIGGCNNNKKKKMPDQWLLDKFGKRKAKQILSRIQAYFDSLE